MTGYSPRQDPAKNVSLFPTRNLWAGTKGGQSESISQLLLSKSDRILLSSSFSLLPTACDQLFLSQYR